MQLRMATPDDVPAVMALVHRVVPVMQAQGNLQWNAAYPNAAVFEQDISRGHLWIVIESDAVIGVAAITTDPEPDYAQAGLDIDEAAVVVHRLAVDPAIQRGGVGRALMIHAEQIAGTLGINALRVDTNTSNEATQRMFPKLGYRLAGEISLSGRPGLRFLCYEKRLGAEATSPLPTAMVPEADQ